MEATGYDRLTTAPVLPEHRQEGIDDGGIELGWAAAQELGDGIDGVELKAIGWLLSHCIVRVHDGDDTRGEGNRRARQLHRVAAATEPLVGGAHDGRDAAQGGTDAQDIGADLNVPPHDGHLARCERRGLRQQSVGHGSFPDVVQARGGVEFGPRLRVHAQRSRDGLP